jgi:hypothetical protein
MRHAIEHIALWGIASSAFFDKWAVGISTGMEKG